jgi:hypothetical protein
MTSEAIITFSKVIGSNQLTVSLLNEWASAFFMVTILQFIHVTGLTKLEAKITLNYPER